MRSKSTLLAAAMLGVGFAAYGDFHNRNLTASKPDLEPEPEPDPKPVRMLPKPRETLQKRVKINHYDDLQIKKAEEKRDRRRQRNLAIATRRKNQN